MLIFSAVQVRTFVFWLLFTDFFLGGTLTFSFLSADVCGSSYFGGEDSIFSARDLFFSLFVWQEEFRVERVLGQVGSSVRYGGPGCWGSGLLGVLRWCWWWGENSGVCKCLGWTGMGLRDVKGQMWWNRSG